MTKSPFTSRKFILTLLFTAITVANSPLNLNLSWDKLLVLATMFGLYSAGNVADKLAFRKSLAPAASTGLDS